MTIYVNTIDSEYSTKSAVAAASMAHAKIRNGRAPSVYVVRDTDGRVAVDHVAIGKTYTDTLKNIRAK